jgi:hypothetical protein
MIQFNRTVMVMNNNSEEDNAQRRRQRRGCEVVDRKVVWFGGGRLEKEVK